MSGSTTSAALWSGPTATRAFDVLGIGENSLDRICVLDAPPQSGAKEPLRGYSERPGGQVATTVLACARLGLRCAYRGAVGDDPAADIVLAPLAEAGVELSGVVRVPDTATRLAVILVERHGGERSVLWHRDPRLALAPQDLSRRAIESARVLELDATDPDATRWAARIARDAGTAVVLDLDRPFPGTAELLRDVDFPIVSGEFAESLGEGADSREALRELAAQGARLAVVTLGPRGAIARGGDRVIESPAYRVRAVDTTGAGDAFRGGFIWALLRGEETESVLRAANATAALCCRCLGAQSGLPELDQLQSFLSTEQPAQPIDAD